MELGTSRMRNAERLGTWILAASLLLGVLGDVLLRAVPWGLNLTLWIGALLVVVGGLVFWNRVDLAGEGRWLVAPALFFAAAIAWRDSMALFMLNLAALIGAMALGLFRTRSGRICLAGVTDYIRDALIGGLSVMVGFLSLVVNDVTWRGVPSGRWSGQAAAVGRGVIIAIPLLLIFGGLFVAADVTFERIVRRLIFFPWDWEALTAHVLLFAFWTWLAGGFLRQLLLGQHPTSSAGRRPESSSIGIVEMGVVLGALNALFLAFVLVQLRYFFGGAELVQTSTTLTYAAYARRGFFELVTVAALVLPLVLVADWLFRPTMPVHRRLFRALAAALILLLFVIMASAIQRMRLYQIEFGLTELRLYTTAFMGWLAVVFVWFLATVLRGRRERFAFGALAAGFAIVALLDVLNPDAFIVRGNASRLDAPRPFDVRYTTSLSADAVPTLVEVLPTMAEHARRAAAAEILAQWLPPPQSDWRTWNVGRAQAWQAVSANRSMLEQIVVGR